MCGGVGTVARPRRSTANYSRGFNALPRTPQEDKVHTKRKRQAMWHPVAIIAGGAPSYEKSSYEKERDIRLARNTHQLQLLGLQ